MVKPLVTTTSAVRQQLWCSGLQFDTVIVYKDAVGIKDLEVYLENVNLFPNLASNKLNIKIGQQSIINSIQQCKVQNQLGQTLSLPINTYAREQLQLDVSSLPAGIYLLRFELDSGVSFTKRFVVER